MMKFIFVCALTLAACDMLSGCATMPEAGYVCTTDCHHECPDGPSGLQCREMKKQQDKDNDSSN